MPIYEYRCNCGFRFEKLCRINDDSVQFCPQCGGETRRIVSLFKRGRSSGDSGSPGRADHSSVGGGCSGCTSSSCAGCR